MRLFCLRAFLIIFLGTASLASAQNHSAKRLFENVWDDQKQVWLFPFQPESWKEPRFWLLTGISASSFAMDGDITRELKDGSVLDGLDFLSSEPSNVAVHSVPLIFLLGGKLADNRHLTEFGWKSAEAAIDAILVSRLLKLATQRSRPHVGAEYGFWEGGNSFPSGHATLAWSLAAVAAEHFEEERWVRWVVFPAAGLVSLSRISSGNHFVSDAVVGSILGYGIGRYAID